MPRVDKPNIVPRFFVSTPTAAKGTQAAPVNQSQMSSIIKKIGLSSALLLSSFCVTAQTFTENGITYSVTDTEKSTVSVQKVSLSEANSTYITIPSYVVYNSTTYTVTAIGESSFYWCWRELTGVSIPNTITYIGTRAFSLCDNMTRVDITDLEAWCNIQFEEWNSNPLFCAHNLYCNGDLVTELTIPETVTSIGKYAFMGMQNVTAITIPNSVTSIGTQAFEECTDLQKVFIPGSVSSMEPYAFNRCSKLTDIILQEGIPSIGRSAFSNCKSLTEVIIPTTVSTIGQHAFGGCLALTKVALPNSVSVIGSAAFQDCISLQEINIPNSISEIARTTFQACRSLTKIDIPGSVSTIGDNAFYGCNALTEIVIPASVTSIGDKAFYECSGLKSVTSLSRTPCTLSDNTFYGLRDCTLYVPKGTAERYSDARWYGYWASIYKVVELPAMLSVKYSGNGEILLNGSVLESGSILDGSDYDFIVLPADGYKVGQIMLGDEDCTAMMVNHHFIVKDLDTDLTLSVEFVEEAYATLTVKNGHVHGAKHHYLAGTSAKIELQPEEGWSVHSVTLNGEDVTEMLINNELTTEPLEGENSLDVVYKQDAPDAITETEASALKVQVHGRTVTVGGKADGDIVRIYDTKGVLLYAGTDSSIVLTGSEQCVFISINGETFKAALR